MNIPTQHEVIKEVKAIMSVDFIDTHKCYDNSLYQKDYVFNVWQELCNRLPNLQIILEITRDDYIITITRCRV